MLPNGSQRTIQRAARQTMHTCSRRRATRHNVQQLSAGDVDDLGRPQSVPERSVPAEQHLIEPDRSDVADAVRVIDQRGAVVDDRVHHGVPVATEIGGDLGHRAAMAANLERRPPPVRSVIAARSAAMRSSDSPNVTIRHVGFGHRHRCFNHTSRVRRPKHGRSANSTSSMRWRHTTPAQPEHDGRDARAEIEIRNQCGQSPTPFTSTSGRPTSSSHVRVGSVSNRGSPGFDDVRHRQIRRAPVSRPGSTRDSPHAQIRRTNNPPFPAAVSLRRSSRPAVLDSSVSLIGCQA